jgi:hypothetical protein
MLTIHEFPAASSEAIFDDSGYTTKYEIHIKTVIILSVQLQRITITTKQYLWAYKKNSVPWYDEDVRMTTVPFTNKDLSTIDVSSAQIYHLDTACSDNQTFTVTDGSYSSGSITYSYTYSYDPSVSVADTFNVKMSGAAYLHVDARENIGTSAENAVEHVYKYEFIPTYE